MQILDQRKLEDLQIGRVPSDHGHFRQPRLLRGSPPAFPGDQFMPAGDIRTISGWMIPCWRIDSTSSFRESRAKSFRGCSGLGTMLERLACCTLSPGSCFEPDGRRAGANQRAETFAKC